MPRIEPFKGVLYDPRKIKMANVVAPPYDVIPSSMQEALYRESDYNVVRLILGKQSSADSAKNNRYTRARDAFNRWAGEGILKQDAVPAIYVYSQDYRVGTARRKSVGFIARMMIEDPKTSRVLPHERTFAKPKEDRLNLTREVKANLSPIFTLYPDDKNVTGAVLQRAMKKAPFCDVTSEGVRHRLWRLQDETQIQTIQRFLGNKDVFIADGHHRFEVARMYREEMRSQRERPVARQTATHDYDYVMTYFAPLSDKTLTILATHRLLKGVDLDIASLLMRMEEYFTVEECATEKELFAKMESVGKGRYAVGVYAHKRPFYLLTLKKNVNIDRAITEKRSREWKRLDVSILHGIIFDRITGLKEKIAN
ncbi:MAG: DUF1015 domain-containing protein [Candidatus Omnitrophota bacterium]